MVDSTLKMSIENEILGGIEMNILILGTCSSKKNSVSSPTPAYEVYEGPQHQYLVKAWDKLKNALGGGIR